MQGFAELEIPNPWQQHGPTSENEGTTQAKLDNQVINVAINMVINVVIPLHYRIGLCSNARVKSSC
jgi:hypothetical protein